MGRTRVGLAAWILASALAASAAAQTEAELEEARATFAEGVELTREERWGEAAERFRAVHEVRATAQVKYNLGLSLARSGSEREGLRYLREAEADASLDEESRAEAQAEIARLEREGVSAASEGADGTGEGEGEGEDHVEAEAEDGASDDPPPTGSRPFEIDVHAGFSWWGFGLATGARLGIPLVHEGLPGVGQNAIYLTVGADFYFVQRGRAAGGGHNYGPGLGIPVTVQWQLYLSGTWTVFAELGAQFFMHPSFFNNGNYRVYEPGYWVVAAVGATLRLSEMFALTLRVGTPYTVLGLTIRI